MSLKAMLKVPPKRSLCQRVLVRANRPGVFLREMMRGFLEKPPFEERVVGAVHICWLKIGNVGGILYYYSNDT